MPNSYAQSAQLTCPVCGQPFAADIWLIVDVDERPDLAARARTGDLHAVACPRCGPQGAVDAPLLLYLPHADPATGQPPLIFSPAQQTSAEQDQEMANGLLGTLAQRLGAAWQDEWLAQVATVQRQLLPVALSDDPAAAMREMSEEIEGEEIEEEEIEGELPPAVAAALEAVLRQLAEEGATVESPEDLERALAARPDLRAKLEAAVREISPDDNPGIFEDSGIVPGEDLPALINRAKLEAVRREISPDDNPGIFEDSGIVPGEDHAPALPALLDRFVRLNTWDDAQRMVEEHPALLNDEADQMFAAAIAQAQARQNAGAVEHFTRLQAVLRRCREAGVARAFAEQMLPPEALAEAERLGLAPEAFLAQTRAAQQTNGPAVPPEFAADLRAAQEGEQRYRRSGGLAALDAAAAAWARILDAPGFTTADARFRLAALNDSAIVFIRRYQGRGQPRDLDRALAGWEQAVKLTPPDSPDRPSLLNNLGNGLSDRYARTGRLEDLEAAIGVYEQAVKLTPPDSPDRPGSLNNLGTGLSDRYARTGRLEDLEAAIGVYEQAVKGSPPDSPDRPSLLNNLGTGLSGRYARTGRLEDLEAAIGVYEQAVKGSPPDSPDRPSLLNNLGNGLRGRYARTGRLEDLEAAIGVYEQAVKLTPPDSPDRPSLLNNLGNGLRDRYARTGRLEDLEAAIGVYEQAVKGSPPDSPDRPGSLNNLGAGLSDRYARTGRLEDLEAAIGVYEQAVKLTPPDSPDRPGSLNNLGTGLRSRYARTGRLEDLEAAIGVYEQAVKLTPPDSPDRPSLLNNLGAGLSSRYARTGRLEDLEAAIGVYEQAVKLTPPDSPDRPSLLNNLGNGLRSRYARTGRLEDLEAAIGVYEQAVKGSPPDSPDRPSLLNNLGAGLSSRYARTGRLEDLEAAIGVYEHAVKLTPPDSPDRPMYLNNLGNGLSDRYARTGRLEDLEAAIGVYEQAVKGSPPDSPDRPSLLNNLGAGLSGRYARTGRLEDLEAAIGVYEQAVKGSPPDSPDRPGSLNNLGNGLRDRYARTGRLEDLEAAIGVYEQAVKGSPPDSPDRPSRLNNLGNGLRDRYARTGRLEDLEAAIEVYEQAVKGSPPDSPDRPSLLNNLGAGLSDRYARTGRLEDLEAAIHDYRAACELGAAAAPQEVLNAARNWGRWAMQRQAWAEVDEAYGYGLATGRALHRRQVRRADKESWLRDVQEMAPAAAYAQARLGDLPRAAVTLEAGRAQLLAEGLEQNRRDLERLPSLGHGDLHARYLAALAARRRLEQSDAVVADRLAAIVAADREFDAVVAAIRSVDGYADFFAEPTFARLQAAAQDGPLVYLAATAAGGLALIVHGQEHKPGFSQKPGLSADAVTTVWLDDLTAARVREWLYGPADDPELGGWLGAYQGWLQALQQAQQFSRLPRDDARRQAAEAAAATAQTQWFATLDAVTAALWPAVLAPLTTALTNLTIPQSPSLSISNLQSPPALTLIPTGLLALLPLHAAWRADPAAPTGRRYFLDDYVVRYAPSATALGHAAQTAATAGAERLLAIDEPAVAGAGRLPNSAREVAAVAGHFTAPTLLAHAAATRTAVLAQLADAQVVHFSCHGANDWGDPLASGLFMAGGERLTVADVLALRLGGARLATLSACETGIPGASFPDEAVMLPSALLQAGYAGVAASLWTVSDISTAMLMAYFYKLWRDDGVDPPAALVLAQRWLRDSSNGEKQAFFAGYAPELASELKMGMAMAVEFFVAVRKQGLVEERSFAAPYHWAAFYFTGA